MAIGAGSGRTRAEGLVDVDGELFYAIPDVDRSPAFLASVVSDGDRWMFVSSTGALTAGRTDATAALFPYETDDRIHGAAGAVGPVTHLRVASGGETRPWQPFAPSTPPSGTRTLMKSVRGHAIIFEESRPDLGLVMSYRWDSTDAHGFVRTATLTNQGDAALRVEVLDGLLGVLPHGMEPIVHQRLSNLSNAYKRSELIDDSRLAVFSLESPVSDRAEPQEVLRATVVWSWGADDWAVTLDREAARAFAEGHESAARRLVTGRPGAYLLRGDVDLDPGASTTWRVVADVARDQVDVTALHTHLASGTDVGAELDTAIAATCAELTRIMALADADQCSNDAVACAHHVANVTYNVMRAGVPRHGYRIDTADFGAFVSHRNRRVAERHAAFLGGLSTSIDRAALLVSIEGEGDAHLLRLALEYLPFSFSRRHGDPSRPWNQFAIRVRDDDGNPMIHYEGNWRDVFQNWEALCVSFPEYLPSVISVFVDASTADGHNPYRISRDGIDWEVPDPEDPWSNIGYWGDHQLVYLLRLLTAADRFRPGSVASMLGERRFTYADVPYRIASYDELVRDPKATIVFDDAAHARSTERAAALGGDGKLVAGPDGQPLLVTLAEKMLVAALAKLANYVPGGGIWMNTQRPEWNDANNALVGYGLSVVTLCHLRHYLDHLRTLAAEAGGDIAVSTEVAAWLDAATSVLVEQPTAVDGVDGDRHRKQVLDGLGHAASRYRARIYDHGLSGDVVPVATDAIAAMCVRAIAHLDATIATSRRPDGLMHSYNLLRFSGDGTVASITHLAEMLEGQVAALTPGTLTPRQQADLVDALFASRLYRPDQDSFMLAPEKLPPSFLDKNVIDAGDVASNALLSALLTAGDTSVVRRDDASLVRFHPDLIDAPALDAALDRLAISTRWQDLVQQHRSATLAVYEQVFAHDAFMGRSVAMYAYEGIGSIYWHMVAKLLLAIQEAGLGARRAGAARETVARLVDAYERVRAGLGFNKTAVDFGAPPIDPYSHTPSGGGAQQPGMTGAVKEELLARPAELGVRVEDGEVVFDALFLRISELLDAPSRWSIVSTEGEATQVELEAGTLGLTLCQVPIVVSLTDGEPHVDVHFADGRVERRRGGGAGRDVSAMVFARTGQVVAIHAALA